MSVDLIKERESRRSRTKEAVIDLWNEGIMPATIAAKLGLERDIVESIIENPANYQEGLW